MTNLTLGQELINALSEVLVDKGKLRIVRPTFDLAILRKDLCLTQEQFANKFHINLQTIRNWEQGKRIPDSATMAYLTCIQRAPDTIEGLLNQ